MRQGKGEDVRQGKGSSGSRSSSPEVQAKPPKPAAKPLAKQGSWGLEQSAARAGAGATVAGAIGPGFTVAGTSRSGAVGAGTIGAGATAAGVVGAGAMAHAYAPAAVAPPALPAIVAAKPPGGGGGVEEMRARLRALLSSSLTLAAS